MFDLQSRLKAWGPEVLHVLAPDEAPNRDRPLDFQLTRYDDLGVAGDLLHEVMEHSPTSATGTGRELTPWHATQRAAWETLLHTQKGTAP